METVTGPTITSRWLTSDTVQMFADGSELLQVTISDTSGRWRLPLNDGDIQFVDCRELHEAVNLVAWDAQVLSQTRFAERYPAFTPVTTREIDATLTAVERGGQLLVFVYREPSTGRWLLQDRDRRLVRLPGGGWNFLQAAVEYVMSNVVDFLPIEPVQLTGVEHSNGTVEIHATGCPAIPNVPCVWDADATTRDAVIREAFDDQLRSGALKFEAAEALTRFHECTGLAGG